MASNNTRGGTPEQHAEAGRQSYKNDGNKSGGAGNGSTASKGSGQGAVKDPKNDGRLKQNR